jgi:hypothetical protein
MDLREELDAVETIQRQMRNNAFNYTPRAFECMVDQGIYEEDVVRGMETAEYVGADADRKHPLFIFRGRGMDDQTLALVCRLHRNSVRIVCVLRIPRLETPLWN